MNFLISSAYAQDAAAAAAPSPIASFLPLILIFVVFYFLLIRPQQKKYKQHQALVAAIKKNDKIVTNGGVHGKVTKAGEGDSFLHVEIASGVEIKVERSSVASLVDKKPANDNKAEISKKA